MRDVSVLKGLETLLNKGYLRTSTASNPVSLLNSNAWKFRQNYVFNSGFEIDDGKMNEHWHRGKPFTWGNKFGGDLVPDGWELGEISRPGGMEQVAYQQIELETGKEYIASMWVKATPETDKKCYMEISSWTFIPTVSSDTLTEILNAGEVLNGNGVWRRYYTTFSTKGMPGQYIIATLTLGHEDQSDEADASFDGIQVEENLDPENPFPSIWTDDGGIIAGNASATSLKQIFADASGTSVIASASDAIIQYGHF
ncbi:hypothetical protein ACFL35_20005 [Candidatus Riflebacteria bacterium]